MRTHEFWMGEDLLVEMAENGTIERAEVYCTAINDWIDAKSYLEKSPYWMKKLSEKLESKMTKENECHL